MRYFVFSGDHCHKKEALLYSEVFGHKTILSEHFFEEQELFLNTPFSFPRLDEALNTVSSFLREQEIIFLIDIKMREGFLYKGPEIETIEKVFIPRFEQIFGKPFFLSEIKDYRKISYQKGFLTTIMN